MIDTLVWLLLFTQLHQRGVPLVDPLGSDFTVCVMEDHGADYRPVAAKVDD